MAKEISITEAQRRIIEMVNTDDADLLNSEVDNEGQIVIYTGLYLRGGKIYDEPEPNELEVIRDLIAQAESIFNSDLDWETKYDQIFGMKIARKILDAGYSFDYYDPDTTYQEDVTAYMRALTDGLSMLFGDNEIQE